MISKHGFASVVEHKDKPGWLLVRGRDRGDLEEFCEVARDCDVPGFSEQAIEEDPNADYRFRMTVKDKDWGQLAKALAIGISYPNFKNEVASVDRKRAEIYSGVWSQLTKIQFPESEGWIGQAEASRRENLVRMYRGAADRLESCLVEYEGSLPAADEEEILGEVLAPPVPADGLEPDVAEVLEEKMLQRIAIGFWERAEGRGFERLRNAIAQARKAAALQLTDSDWTSAD
jgi:hypothetical protein